MRIILGKGIDPSVREDIIRVKDAYLDHLCNTMLFEWKLNRLNVIVHEQRKGKNGFPSDHGGSLHFSDDKYTIHILPDPDQRKEDRLFVLAHEFAHLLFAMCFNQNGVNCQDGFVFASSLTRLFATKNQVFISEAGDGSDPEPHLEQDGIEEFCDNAVAHYILVQMGLPEDWWRQSGKEDESCDEDDIWPAFDTQLSYVHRLAGAFGKPLMQCRYIDEVTPYAEEQGIVSNYFWYNAVTFQMKTLVDWIDQHLGMGAYMRLECAFDLFLFEGDLKAADTIQRFLLQIERLPLYQVTTDTRYTREYRRIRYRHRLNVHSFRLGQMITLEDSMHVRHPEYGDGEILSVDDQGIGDLRFHDQSMRLPLAEIVQACMFTDPREGFNIIIFQELDTVRSLLKKVEEATEKSD